MELNLKQEFIDKFRHSVIKDKAEWDFRFRQVGYRVLLSTFFFISSKKCYQQKNKLIPCVGLYYSFFHLALALMCIHPAITLDRLPRFQLDEFRKNAYGFKKFTQRYKMYEKRFMTHKEIESFLGKCVRERLISADAYESFLDAKHLRWIANYAPTYDRPTRFDEMNSDLINRMEAHLEEFYFLIVKLNQEYMKTAAKHNLLPLHIHDHLASFIGDGIGDDFMECFLSDGEEKEVIDILVKNGLST